MAQQNGVTIERVDCTLHRPALVKENAFKLLSYQKNDFVKALAFATSWVRFQIGHVIVTADHVIKI
jgi:hypothetical protein